MTALKESEHESGDAEELMLCLREGRHNELLITHDFVAELIKLCEVLNGKQSGYPHLCGVTFPCGEYDVHSFFWQWQERTRETPTQNQYSVGTAVTKPASSCLWSTTSQPASFPEGKSKRLRIERPPRSSWTSRASEFGVLARFQDVSWSGGCNAAWRFDDTQLHQ